jgi:peptidoglycan/xylan/chitin deacetylase (PgdA/CDA1 family)
MILMYHKVDIIRPTMWWVTSGALERQLAELSDKRFVYLDDYDSPATQVVITFDDAYENLAHHALPVLRAARAPFEVFVIGDVLGSWNDFDDAEPPTRHLDHAGLDLVVSAGGRIQWHTRTHPDLRSLDDTGLRTELSVPEALRVRYPSPHLAWLAYPGGLHDVRVVSSARPQFAGAVSVIAGQPDDRWQLNRITVEESTSFASPYLSAMGVPGARTGSGSPA